MSTSKAEQLFAHMVPRLEGETDQAWNIRVYTKIKGYHGRDAVVIVTEHHATVVGESELKVAVDKAMRAESKTVHFSLNCETMEFSRDALVSFLQKPYNFYFGYRIFEHDGNGRYTCGRIKLL